MVLYETVTQFGKPLLNLDRVFFPRNDACRNTAFLFVQDSGESKNRLILEILQDDLVIVVCVREGFFSLMRLTHHRQGPSSRTPEEVFTTRPSLTQLYRCLRTLRSGRTRMCLTSCCILRQDVNRLPPSRYSPITSTIFATIPAAGHVHLKHVMLESARKLENSQQFGE